MSIIGKRDDKRAPHRVRGAIVYGGLRVPNHRQKGQVAVPCILLGLSLLALLVSVFGLQRATFLSGERLQDLQSSWTIFQDQSLQGSEVMETSRLIEGLQVPVPAARSAARWSLGLALVSMLLLIWLLVALRRKATVQGGQSELPGVDAGDDQLGQLSAELYPVMEGDLRVSLQNGRQWPDALTSVINHTIGELRWLVRTIGASADQIREQADNSRRHEESETEVHRLQAQRLGDCSEQLSVLAASATELSVSSSREGARVRKTLEQIEESTSSIESSLVRFRSSDSQISASNASLKRVQDSLLAIDEQVQAIQDVRRDIELLALNTTIRVSAGTDSLVVEGVTPGAVHGPASTASSEFSRLSDDVGQLAKTLSESARELSHSSIALAAAVDESTQLAEKAREYLEHGINDTGAVMARLDHIAVNNRELEHFLSSLSDTVVANTSAQRRLTEIVDDIGGTRREPTAGHGRLTAIHEKLDDLADELQSSIAEYRLPASDAEHKEESAASPGRNISPARRAADRAVIHG